MNCQSNFKHKEPQTLTGMNVYWAMPFGIRFVLKHIKKMCKRAQVSHQVVLQSHTQRQALFPVYHPACVLCKTNGKQLGNAELCSHSLQTFPKLAQAEGKSTGPRVSAVSPHTSALKRGYSMIHGKLQHCFCGATIKILRSEEAVLPDKLMPWGKWHIYSSLWQKAGSQAYNESWKLCRSPIIVFVCWWGENMELYALPTMGSFPFNSLFNQSHLHYDFKPSVACLAL